MSFLDDLERDLLGAAERRRSARRTATAVRARRLRRLWGAGPQRFGLRGAGIWPTGLRGAGPRLAGLRAAGIRRLAFATALFALIGTATAGAGLYVLRGSVIPGPAVRDVPPDQLPAAGTTRMTGLIAIDPAPDRPPWTLRVARSSTGLLCSTVGQLVDGKFGLVGLDGRFRTYSERIVDSCGAQVDGPAVSLVGARVFDADDPREVRTVVNGVGGRELEQVVVDAGARRITVPVGAGGTFLHVLRGYPEDSALQVELRFAGGHVEVLPLGRSAAVVPDPDGGQAWRMMAFAIGDDRRSCVSFMTARPGTTHASSPPACGLLQFDGRRTRGFYFAVRRLAGSSRDRRGSFQHGNWGRHPPRTAVWGGVGDDVAAVEVRDPAGQLIPLPLARSRTFLAVFPAAVDPASLTVVLRFADGHVERFNGSTGLVTRKVPSR